MGLDGCVNSLPGIVSIAHAKATTAGRSEVSAWLWDFMNGGAINLRRGESNASNNDIVMGLWMMNHG